MFCRRGIHRQNYAAKGQVDEAYKYRITTKNRLINVNTAHFEQQVKYARKYKSKLNVLPIQECLQQSLT